MEYNTDGAAGWHYTAALSALWREREPPAGSGLLAQEAPGHAPFLLPPMGPGGMERPRMAIVDWAEVGTRSDQEALAAAFAVWGIPTSLEDPRALRAEGGRIRGEHGAYDLVYRRVVSEEVFSRAEEIRPFSKPIWRTPPASWAPSAPIRLGQGALRSPLRSALLTIVS